MYTVNLINYANGTYYCYQTIHFPTEEAAIQKARNLNADYPGFAAEIIHNLRCVWKTINGELVRQ